MNIKKELLLQIKGMDYNDLQELAIDKDGALVTLEQAYAGCYDFVCYYNKGRAFAYNRYTGKLITTFKCSYQCYKSWMLEAYEQEAEDKGERFIRATFIKDNIDEFLSEAI